MQTVQTGMEQLLVHPDCDSLLAGRVALVGHPASVNGAGQHSAYLLRERLGNRLCCLMGPEHGFFGRAAPGEKVADTQHSDWQIPIYSLYGNTEVAMQALAEEVDVVVLDLQDLAVRCYTYLHTLRQILEAASRHDIRVIVTDRMVPLGSCLDGPMLDANFQSIVAPVRVPFVYGMTPGETARWLVDHMEIDVMLTVVPASGQRHPDPMMGRANWVPPSPAIRSWHCAVCFPITVFTEALLQLDCARETDMAFQVLRADWLNVDGMLSALCGHSLPGITFQPCEEIDGVVTPGIQLIVTDATLYRPSHTAVVILSELVNVHGLERIWHDSQVRMEWFDKLFGTDQVRLALLRGDTPECISTSWAEDMDQFRREREAYLLYPESLT